MPGIDNNELDDITHMTPLMRAVDFDFDLMVTELLEEESGVDLSVQNADGHNGTPQPLEFTAFLLLPHHVCPSCITLSPPKSALPFLNIW